MVWYQIIVTICGQTKKKKILANVALGFHKCATVSINVFNDDYLHHTLQHTTDQYGPYGGPQCAADLSVCQEEAMYWLRWKLHPMFGTRPFLCGNICSHEVQSKSN